MDAATMQRQHSTARANVPTASARRVRYDSAQMDLSSWKVVYFLALISAGDHLISRKFSHATEIYLFINKTQMTDWLTAEPLAAILLC